MRNKIVICACIALAMSVLSGCARPVKSSEEAVGIDGKEICGVVESVTDSEATIRLATSIVAGTEGAYYIKVKSSEDLAVKEDVIVSYEGEMDFTAVSEGKYEAEDVDVIDVKPYVNDYTFEALVSIAGNFVDENGNEYPADDPRSGCLYYVSSAENAPEGDFGMKRYGEERLRIDISKPVTVTYDPDTMEILTVTQ